MIRRPALSLCDTTYFRSASEEPDMAATTMVHERVDEHIKTFTVSPRGFADDINRRARPAIGPHGLHLLTRVQVAH